jgi:hypothetical protein
MVVCALTDAATAINAAPASNLVEKFIFKSLCDFSGEEEKVNPSLFLHPEVWQGFVTAIFQLASWLPGARL